MASKQWKYSRLEEKYSEIYNELKRFRDQYDEADRHLREFKVEDEVTRQARIDNFNKQLKDIGVYYAQVEYFRRLAEKNITSTNVITLKPLELDFTSLKHDAARIDSENPNDPYAFRLYVHTRCNEIYLQEKQMEFEGKRDTLIYGKNEALDKEKQKAEDAKRRIEERCYAFLRDKKVRDFADELKQFHHSFSDELYNDYALTANKLYDSEDQTISFGVVAQPLPLEGEDANNYASYLLEQFFDKESQSILLPVTYNGADELIIDIRTVTSKENRCFKGISNLCLNRIIRTKPGNRKLKIHYLDAIHYNNSQLKALKPLENSNVISSIPVNVDEIIDTLRNIVSTFVDIDDKLQDVDTVKEFNEKAEKESEKIERQILVLIGYPKAFDNASKSLIQRIIYNHQRYGISVIIVNNLGYGEEIKEDELKGEKLSDNYFHIKMLQNKSTTIDQGDDIILSYRWYEYDYQNHPLPIDFINEIRKDDKKDAGSSNVYTELYPLNIWNYLERNDKERKQVNLPYGLDISGKVSSLSFTEDNFACYLMGASGSGKSTLLHSLITGIIHNYHPDDVELWLADFKMAEFSQYINPRPPHIKYILLDESRELVFDLVDKLTEAMIARQKYFMIHRDIKKVEDVPANKYMPVIFVILDEFSIMSQVLEDEPTYKLKLQNLLAKGRALGIKFIFSSQSFLNGIRGLTATAKEQIQMRIAMKNNKEEIKETLEIPTFLKTEQNITMMETLPKHKALRKFLRKKENSKDDSEVVLEKVNVLYFKGEEQERYKPQRDLINKILEKMDAIPENKFDGNSNYTYVDKDSVIVDGNSFSHFDSKKMNETINRYKTENPDEVYEDDTIVSFGAPRRMINYIYSNISKESRENILVIANPREQACMASIIATAIKSFTLQNRKVQIWAYEKNRLFKAYKDVFKEMGIDIVLGLENICDEIRSLKEKIVQSEPDNKLIVLIGMDHICIDFGYINSKNDSDANKATNQEKQTELNKVIEQGTKGTNRDMLMAMAVTEFMKQFSATEMQLRNEGKNPQEIAEIKNRSRMEFQKKFFAEHSSDMGQPSIATEEKKPIKEAPAAPSDNAEKATEEQKGPYNAASDFDFIVRMGSRLGYHFLAALNGISDIKSMGIKQDYFRYKMAFQVSTDDSRLLFGNGKIGSSLPERICQYDDGLEKYSFRPYIHDGIGWDGWMIQNGVLMSPME